MSWSALCKGAAVEERFVAITARDGVPRPADGKFAGRYGCATRRGRRHCFYIVYALAVACSTPALGQSPTESTPRIGLLVWSSCDERSVKAEFGPFLDGLSELGYTPDETVVYECRSAREHDRGFATAAAALVQVPVDVIVTTSQPAGTAAHAVTDTMPIVTVLSGDPVGAGLARSLAKPGGNLTGVTYYATELSAKRLELLKETIPQLATVGVLANPEVSYLPFEEDTKRAADRLGLAVRLHHVSEPADIATAFARMEAEHEQAVFVLPDVMLAHQAQRIADLALQHRLPTMTWGRWYVPAGCLMAYSADYDAMTHRLAYYVDRILKGAKPGDLPIEQPATFKLLINLRTAQALGIEVPQSVLLLADEVIE